MTLEMGSSTTHPTTIIKKVLPEKEHGLKLGGLNQYRLINPNLKKLKKGPPIFTKTNFICLERPHQTKGILGKFFDFAKGFIKRIK